MERSSVVHLTFDGGGMRVIYHLGVLQFIQEHFELCDGVTFHGVSAGAAVSAVAALGIDVRVVMEAYRQCWFLCRLPFTMLYTVECMTRALLKLQPNHCEKLCNGRVFVYLAALQRCGLRRFHVNTFYSRNELANSIMASCHLPILGGVRPRFVNGTACYDGGNLLNGTVRRLLRSCTQFPLRVRSAHVPDAGHWGRRDGHQRLV